jgi:hypothetical protein
MGMGMPQAAPVNMQQIGAITDETPFQYMQMCAQYEWQVQSKDQKLQELQRRLGHEEDKRTQMQMAYQRDREGLIRHLHELTSAVEKYGVQVDDSHTGDGGHSHCTRPGTTKKFPANKMEHASSPSQDHHGNPPSKEIKASASRASAPAGKRLPERHGASRHSGKGNSAHANFRSADTTASQRSACVSKSETHTNGGSLRMQRSQRTQDPLPDGSSLSKHRVSFTADLVQHIHSEERRGSQGDADDDDQLIDRTMSPEVVIELEKAAAALEQRVGGTIDRQTKCILIALDENDALEALRRAEDLMHSQGGQCENISSILQSVCRKIKRRSETSLRSVATAAAVVSRNHAPSISAQCGNAPEEHCSTQLNANPVPASEAHFPPAKGESKRRHASGYASVPHLRGVPEVTPEPDSHYAGSQSLLRGPGPMPKVAEEASEEDELPDKKVTLVGRPKILQRGVAPPSGMSLRVTPEAS